MSKSQLTFKALVMMFGVPTAIGIILVLLIITTICIIAALQTQGEMSTLAAVTYSPNNASFIQQDWIEVNGLKYSQPLFKSDRKGAAALLSIIRAGEWQFRPDTSLDGDQDSCGPYQQRVMELVTNPRFNQIVRDELKDRYDGVFTGQRVEMVKDFYQRHDKGIRTPIAVSSDYGPREVFGKYDFHRGLDLPFNSKEVSAPEEGTVAKVVEDKDWGNVVMINHEVGEEGSKKKFQSIYAHLERSLVKEGDKVGKGQIFAISGGTGASSTGEHLHFQIMDTWDADKFDVSHTIDPKVKADWLSIEANQFLGLCAQLTDIHLRSGLFDKIAIARLEQEAATKDLLDQPLTEDKEPAFVMAGCLSQRPVEVSQSNCGAWGARAMQVLKKLAHQ